MIKGVKCSLNAIQRSERAVFKIGEAGEAKYVDHRYKDISYQNIIDCY